MTKAIENPIYQGICQTYDEPGYLEWRDRQGRSVKFFDTGNISGPDDLIPSFEGMIFMNYISPKMMALVGGAHKLAEENERLKARVVEMEGKVEILGYELKEATNQ